MSKKLKNFEINFKVKVVPSVIVTVSAIVLICGVYYVYAAYIAPATVASKDTLTASAWNIIVNDIIDLNGRSGGSCTVVNSGAPSAGDPVSVTCPSGRMTGGGCLTGGGGGCGDQDLLNSYPSSANTWSCLTSSYNCRTVAAYAICCP